ncbi:carotenoid oxygenase family protein (plasmid) [Kovacikia minuta CCNUW1]|uniref:carotenoid oxygenase family protein n=1 Tax=Kovacikia minuta TaxID=2931930 RepID=UPI001CCF18E2|nr:carotenoid oxygenase family protein [Kovacikia minuta]UBF30001.1 carotenoid oxygenase family protein [Kovacikia minuta CCNUW1]
MVQELPRPFESQVFNCCPLVPQSILTANRYELTDTRLEIEGTLPEDLHGHVFIVEPCGSIDSNGLPYADGNSILGGDGMIYRLDFDHQGEVRLTSRLVKPPDFFADKATQAGSEYEQYQFCNHGITRFSLSLGCRNQLNTAFLPMNFGDNTGDRLLVTYDAGRPYEIDTETLEVVTPVGANQEWVGELDGLNVPFQLYMSTAHPAFDEFTQQMFTVNFGRSLGSFLETIPAIFDINQLPQELDDVLSAIADIFRTGFLKDIFVTSLKIFQNIWQLYANWIEKLIGIDMENFLYLIRWDGAGSIERWKLVLPDRSPVRIQQCIHQIGVTQDYVVIMDTAFTVGTDQIINNPFPRSKGGDQLFRQILERPAAPDSTIYIVRRRDLQAGQKPACSQHEVEVVVQKVTIPLATAHFLLDYDNPDGNMTLHAAHICAMEVSDWLREHDSLAFEPHPPVPRRLCGMILNEVDIGRVGKYVINGETGSFVASSVITHDPCTWGVELFAYITRMPTTGLPPKRLENIYWCTLGLWKELMTQFIFDLFEDYPYQLIPRSEVLRRAETGIPACLFRLDTGLMEIADHYLLPASHLVLSPQFVPRGDGEDSTNGYLLCTVFTPIRSEVWVFDAQDLARGPLCKLHHPAFVFAFTLHTAWLPEIGRRQASYAIGVRQDYDYLVKRKSPEIQQFFEKEVYPHFEANLNNTDSIDSR